MSAQSYRRHQYLISAILYSHGKPKRLVQMALAGEINLTVSPAIISELVDVLERKFNASPRELAQARDLIAAAARVVRPSVSLNVVEDPTDNRILDAL